MGIVTSLAAVAGTLPLAVPAAARALPARSAPAAFSTTRNGVTCTGPAANQLTLLRRVTRPGLLASADRLYLQGLMASVVQGQRWGVPVGAPAAASVGLKNGWLHRTTRGWRIHSMGWVRLRTTTSDVVILSDGNRSLSGGIQRLDTVARAVHAALGHRR